VLLSFQHDGVCVAVSCFMRNAFLMMLLVYWNYELTLCYICSYLLRYDLVASEAVPLSGYVIENKLRFMLGEGGE
jgi:hypothetical protein